jgi:transcriptional regulator with XRE-family HTH domain
MQNTDVEYDDWRKKLGREVRDCRRRLGWDQITLAKRATPIMYPQEDREISTETISRVENGGSTKTDMLNALAVALDVQVRVKLVPNKPEGDTPKASPPVDAPTPERSIPEEVRSLLSDIPPPAGVVSHAEVESSDPASRLARIGAELLSVIEALEARRQAPMARGNGPDRVTRDRKDRGRKDRRHPTKTTQKRR